MFGGTGKTICWMLRFKSSDRCCLGNQGRAVVQSLLSHRDRIFEARVVTRDPTSPQALEVAGLGASLARADGFNRAEIAAALEGSWGVFINSNSDGQVGLPPERTVP